MTDYDRIEKAKKIIEELLFSMGVKATVDYEESITKGLIFNISSPESYMLIGRLGSTLNSLQSLAQALVLKQTSTPDAEPLRFSLDVDDYKRKREWFLKETARGAVGQLKKTGRPVRLEPLPSYERRLIHSFLQENFPEVQSESQGEDPYRRVVIHLKR
jgi:spoIIIJ-associated protein